MPMIRSLSPLAVLLLAACSPQPHTAENPQQPSSVSSPAPASPMAPAPTTAPAPTPASPSSPVDGSAGQRLRATGTEPFWAVDVDGTRLLYMTPDNPDGTVLTASETPFARGSTWEGSHAGQPFSLTLREDGVCSDGMSEREYRYHADFDIAGQQLHGCADSVEVLDRPAP